MGDSKATIEAAKRAEEERKKKEEENQNFKREISETVGVVQNQTKELKDMMQTLIAKQQEQSIQPQIGSSAMKSGRSAADDIKYQELQAQVNRLRTMVMDQQLFSSPSQSQQPPPLTQTYTPTPAATTTSNNSSFMSPIATKQSNGSNVNSTPIQPTTIPTSNGLPAWQLESNKKASNNTTTTTTTTTNSTISGTPSTPTPSQSEG